MPPLPAVTVRVLPPEEWLRLLTDGVEPYASAGHLPDPTTFLLLVAEVDGRIIGLSSLYPAVLNDWWIAPEGQKQTAVGLGLWRETMAQLTARGVPLLHATVGDPAVQTLVERLGFVAAPAALYVLSLPDCPVNRGR